MATWLLLTGKHTEKKITYKKDGTIESIDVQPVEAGGSFESDHDFSREPDRYRLLKGPVGKGRPRPDVMSERGYKLTVRPVSGPGKAAADNKEKAPTGRITDGDLDKQTVENLAMVAETEGVDLTKCKNKADIVAAIKAVRAAGGGE